MFLNVTRDVSPPGFQSFFSELLSEFKQSPRGLARLRTRLDGAQLGDGLIPDGDLDGCTWFLFDVADERRKLLSRLTDRQLHDAKCTRVSKRCQFEMSLGSSTRVGDNSNFLNYSLLLNLGSRKLQPQSAPAVEGTLGTFSPMRSQSVISKKGRGGRRRLNGLNVVNGCFARAATRTITVVFRPRTRALSFIPLPLSFH